MVSLKVDATCIQHSSNEHVTHILSAAWDSCQMPKFKGTHSTIVISEGAEPVSVTEAEDIL
jgi:formylmethanofuran dehydrogenase subunit D